MAFDTDVTESLPRHEPEQDTHARDGNMVPRYIFLAVLLLLLVVVTGIVPDFQANRFALAAIFGIVGLSMNMLIGYAGQISLGHQAFVGIGAFMAAYVATEMGLPLFVGLPAAALTGAASALVLGAVALRVRGLYLALVTLAYGVVVEDTIFLWRPFTGGGAGLEAARPIWGQSDAVFAYFCYAMLGLVLFFDWRFARSKAGRAVQAVRDSERVASSMGINVVAFKLMAFVLSGMMAGLAGGLLAHRDTVVVAAPFTFFLALTFVLMTVVGGLLSRTGVLIGSAFFALLGSTIFELLKYIPGLSWLLDRLADPHLLVLVLGPFLLIVTLVSFPGGIGQQIQPIVKWVQGYPFSFHWIHEYEPPAVGGPDVRA